MPVASTSYRAILQERARSDYEGYPELLRPWSATDENHCLCGIFRQVRLKAKEVEAKGRVEKLANVQQVRAHVQYHSAVFVKY